MARTRSELRRFLPSLPYAIYLLFVALSQDGKVLVFLLYELTWIELHLLTGLATVAVVAVVAACVQPTLVPLATFLSAPFWVVAITKIEATTAVVLNHGWPDGYWIDLAALTALVGVAYVSHRGWGYSHKELLLVSVALAIGVFPIAMQVASALLTLE